MTLRQSNAERMTVTSRSGEEMRRLDTRLGALAWRSSGRRADARLLRRRARQPAICGATSLRALDDRYRCVTIDLPLGAHPWPLSPGADRSATSLARLLLDCLELLDLEDVTVIANDTAGGLLLLSLASDHPALARVARLVLTNCDSYDQFPPKSLRPAAALSRTLPAPRPSPASATTSIVTRSAAGSSPPSPRAAWTRAREPRSSGRYAVTARVADDLVAASAGFRPQLLIDGARAIPRFDRPVLLIWGESCDFFPITDAKRLASEFPCATLVSVPGAKTWVPIDNPTAVADSIARYVPTPLA